MADLSGRVPGLNRGVIFVKFVKCFMNDLPADKMNRRPGSKFFDVSEVKFFGACQVGIYCGWAQCSFFYFNHLGPVFFCLKHLQVLRSHVQADCHLASGRS